MTSKLKKTFKDESGITALETAIILIAFVVVASVFAFTILSAGTSSTEKSKEAIYAGVEQVEGSMQIIGSVIAKSANSTAIAPTVSSIEFTLTSAGGGGVDMASTTGENKVVMDYQDESQYETNVVWTKEWLVCNEYETEIGDCDDLLEEDEQILITLTSAADVYVDLGPDTDFLISIKPPQGGVIPVERRTPSDFTAVMNLD